MGLQDIIISYKFLFVNRHFSLFLQLQRTAIDTVPHASPVAWAVGKYMSEVAAAGAAADFGAVHTVCGVCMKLYMLQMCGFGEAGPAGAAVELGGAGK